MKINFAKLSLEEYVTQLSSRQSVPGGGSAAALTASLGAGLVSMVANYSIGRKTNTKALDAQLKKIAQKAQDASKRLLELSSLDSVAYLQVCSARSLDVKAQKAAARQARGVPQEVCKICYQLVQLTPLLVEKGNPYLLSDVEVAGELLMAAFNGANTMVRINS